MKQKKFTTEWCDMHRDEFYEAAMKIWNTPELSMQEYKSSEVLILILKKYGFSIKAGIGGMPTAFIASFGSGKPIIGINAEYDALPGLSQKLDITQKALEHKGAPGHGCGHNLLGTAAVKAAIAIKEAMQKFSLKGTICVIGAIAEELCLGKPYLGRAGLLSGYDAFLDWHPWSYNKANYDSCSAYFNVKFHYEGKTCHGNSPWYGRSALDAAILQSHAVEMLREHIYPGCPPDAANTINFTFSETGPEFPSVVPDTATAWYVGRFVTTEEAQDALERVTRCAEGAALATDTTVTREILTATHHKIPNKVLAELVHNNLKEIGVPQFTKEEQEIAKKIQKELGVAESGLATELLPFEGGYTALCDTSEYSWNAPYASPWIAMGPENAGWHHWGVVYCAGNSMGEKSMDVAAKVIAATAVDLLVDQKLIKLAWDEFNERMKGKLYSSLIPEKCDPPIELNADVMSKYR